MPRRRKAFPLGGSLLRGLPIRFFTKTTGSTRGRAEPVCVVCVVYGVGVTTLTSKVTVLV